MDLLCRFGSVLAGRLAAASLLALLALAALPGCASVEPSPSDPFRSDPGSVLDSDRGSVRTPAWASMPLSWAKLGAIENWLQSPSARTSQYWWIEGQLALNEGRLEFARADLQAGHDSKAVQERLWAARQGLSVVQKNPRSSELQKGRATCALATLEAVRGMKVTGTPTKGVIRRASWRARAPKTRELNTSGNRYTRITVHHSADSITPQLDGTQASSAAAIRRIQQVHMDNSKDPYGDIGYHFVIDPSGRLFEGRELKYQGAHAKGANNKRNIGICLLGNFEHRAPSSAALATLERTLGNLRGKYQIPRSEVYGHQDFRNTLCPGEHLMNWVKRYGGRKR